MSNDTNQTQKAACITSPLESTLVWLHMMAKKRKTEDKEADLLCRAVLRGMSCFDSK